MKCKKCDAYKFLFFAAVFDTDIGFATFAEALEWEVFKIRLNLGIVEFATNKTFCVKDTRIQILGEKIRGKIDLRVVRVHGNLVLCGITDQTFIVGEGYIGRGCAISLVVCNDFYTIILPHTHATKENISTVEENKKLRVIYSRVGCAKVDTDSFRHDDEAEKLERMCSAGHQNRRYIFPQLSVEHTRTSTNALELCRGSQPKL